jgi:hypothetical protein
MSGWKARIGYLSPSVFETPSDWDLILPEGFTIVASGLNVQAHTDAEFNKAIDALRVCELIANYASSNNKRR